MHQQRKKKKKRGRKKRIIIIIILTAVHIFPAVVGLHTRAECVSGEAAGDGRGRMERGAGVVCDEAEGCGVGDTPTRSDASGGG